MCVVHWALMPIELKELVPSEMNPPLNRTLVKDERGLSLVESFLGRTVELGYDLETNIVPNFVHRKIRTMQLGNRDEQYVIDLLAFAGTTEKLQEQGWRKTPDWASPIVSVVRPALESSTHEKVGANLEFEYVTALWCLGIRLWNIWDCYLVEKVLHAGKVYFFKEGFWALDDMVARYTGLRLNKDLQKSFDLETPLTEDQLDYAALDTRLPLAVKKGQSAAVARLRLEKAVYIENHAVPAFSEMHVNGVKMDPEKWCALVDATEAAHLNNIKVLDTHFVPVVGTKQDAEPYSEDQLSTLEKAWKDAPKPTSWVDTGYDADGLKTRKAVDNQRADNRQIFAAARRERVAWEKACEDCTGEAFINYGGPAQLLTALRGMGFGEKKLANTSDKALSKQSEHGVIKAIQEHRSTEKSLSTYGKKWLDYINPDTGLIHARHIQLGAETGRPSCSKPNLYNIPKEKEIRACFTAEEGYALITVDESGAELRIIAELSADKTWVDSFAKNWDMHSVGAEAMESAKWAAAALPDCAFSASKQKCSCPEHKKMREAAKVINFQIAYGGSAYALADSLRIPKERAEGKLRQHRIANAGVHKYLDGSAVSAKMNLLSRTRSGRIRWYVKPTWPLAEERAREDAKKFKREFKSSDIKRKYGQMYGSIEREGKNSPIQGLNADIMKLAMGSGSDKNGKPFMWHLLSQFDFTPMDAPKKHVRLVNHVYDEVVVKCPLETANPCMQMIGDCINRAGAEFMTSVVMDWEGKVANCWSK